jgi:hypothetical protein
LASAITKDKRELINSCGVVHGVGRGMQKTLLFTVGVIQRDFGAEELLAAGKTARCRQSNAVGRRNGLSTRRGLNQGYFPTFAGLCQFFFQ